MESKSVSHEVTFAKNQKALELLEGVLSGLCHQVAQRLRRSHQVGRTVNLKLRYGDFSTVTRQAALGHPTDDAGEILEAAGTLLRTERSLDGRAVRLLGVGVSGLLRRAQMNLDLFGGPGPVPEDLDD
jgi:DNA polymerase-4